MNKIRILHMYADLLDLYGDSGNMEIISYRCRMRGIECEIDQYSIGSPKPDFSSYDILYIGGGADIEQQRISDDLIKYRAEIEEAYKNGIFMFLVCGGFQLMGKHYRDTNGKDIPELGLFDYYTVAETDRKKKCVGDIAIRTEFTGKTLDIVGFENHSGQTHNVKTPLGEVLNGNGNTTQGKNEGYFEKNVIATYMHGPCLAKNPEISDYIIGYCVNRNNDIPTELAPIDDTIEKNCRQIMIDRLMNN
ncbi:MAG: glutamine amidotransferase [Ruminococcus sp.]|nr:glutamine amidotransferase [Ruminococcus sp.]